MLRFIHSVVRKLNHSSNEPMEETVPEWAKEKNQHTGRDGEVSTDPYDYGGKAANSDRGQGGSTPALIDSKLLRLARRELPETFKIGCVYNYSYPGYAAIDVLQLFRSVESFERKLDDAQRNLQLPLSERVPVFYSDEIDWGEQLLKYDLS